MVGFSNLRMAVIQVLSSFPLLFSQEDRDEKSIYELSQVFPKIVPDEVTSINVMRSKPRSAGKHGSVEYGCHCVRNRAPLVDVSSLHSSAVGWFREATTCPDPRETGT